MIISISSAIPTKDPIKEPEIRWQKELNCWQIANHFALAFPLCAKYTIAAAADALPVKRASIACVNRHKVMWYLFAHAIDRDTKIVFIELHISLVSMEFTVSKKTKRILLFCALLLTIWKIERERDKIRYPLTTALAATKNLFKWKAQYFANENAS